MVARMKYRAIRHNPMHVRERIRKDFTVMRYARPTLVLLLYRGGDWCVV